MAKSLKSLGMRSGFSLVLLIGSTLASNDETCTSFHCGPMGNAPGLRALLQRGLTPGFSDAATMSPKEIASGASDTIFKARSNVEVEVIPVEMRLPVGELSRSKKCCFIVASVVLIVIEGLYMRKLIKDYEAAASALTPPWYIDNNMLFMFSSMTLFSWLSLGLLAFTQVILFNDPPRHLTTIESLYLSCQIVTTVGYGDFTPSMPEGQVFLSIYILLGVTLVAIVVAELLDRLVSSQGVSSESFRFRLGVGALEHDGSAVAETFQSSGKREDGSPARQKSKSNPLDLNAIVPHQPRGMMVARSICLFLLAVAVGTAFFCLYPGEGKTVLEAFYMACVTLTTCGFGSIVPVTQGGYFFATFWMLIGVSCTANMIVTIGDCLLKRRNELTEFLMKDELLREMDSDGSGKVDKMEFLRYELVRRGMCAKSDIDSSLALFRDLDRDGSGELDVEDVKLLAQSR